MPCSKSVSGVLPDKRDEIFPNSVSFPVAAISTTAVPLMTWEPINTLFVRLANGASFTTTPAVFSTG